MYSNCGRVGNGGLITSSSSSMKFMSADQLTCELERKEAFSKTFFPFLKETCTRCHQHTQTHASLNLETAYGAFMQTGQQTIVYQATHPHGGNSFGANQQAAINSFLPEWTDASEKYVECMARAGQESGPVTADIRLASKTIANIETTRTNNTVWVPVSFDLPAYPGSTLSLEVQYWLNVRSEAIGLLIRNPRLKHGAGQPTIRFQGLQVFINDTLRQSATMYASLNVTVVGGSDTLLSGGTEAIGIDGVNASIKLGMQLTQVEKNPSGGGGQTEFAPLPTPMGTPVGPGPTPTPNVATVTFSDLVSGPTNLRIFGNNCVSCHKPGNLSGGLDLTSYSAAFSRASTILSRMKSTTSPMPTSGKLPAAQIEKVEAWIAAGKPQ